MNLRKKVISFIMAATVAATALASSFVLAAPTANPDREEKNATISREAAEEGITLLKNDNNALPLTDETIAVFGRGQADTVKGGTGSGQVNNVYNVDIIEGIENAGIKHDEDLAQEYKDWVASYPTSAGFMSSPASGYEWAISKERVQQAFDGGATTAVVVISRISGEFADRTFGGTSTSSGDVSYQTGDYYLAKEEVTMLQNVSAVYDNIIVVLNVGGVVDLNWIAGIDQNNNGVGEVGETEKATGAAFDISYLDGLSVDADAIVYMSLAGQEGGNALANILTGETTPSGKLASTWAEDYADYPAGEQFGAVDTATNPEDRNSSVIYEEGIYVGYRYFDTFNITPAFEFGYGLSYTTFETVTTNVTRLYSEITVHATVTNTGDTYSGKEVVQVYYSAPDGNLGLEKAYQELVAYAKTKELAPGESQDLEITFDLTDMVSYDEASSDYVLEAGDYAIRVGNSSRNTSIEAVVDLRGTVVTSDVENKLEVSAEDDAIANWLSREGVAPYSYDTEEDEFDEARTLRITANTLGNIIETTYADYLGNAEEMTVADEDADKTYTLVDVAEDNATLEQVIAQMSVEELARAAVGASGTLNSGETAIGNDATTVNGAAGESTRFATYFIPNFVMADGPAGVRITQSGTVNEEEYEQNCTAFPIGTLLSMTWNVDTIYEVGEAIGEEMVEYNVDLWLAPGMNIHRDPLCGRNFEYYSEDPVVTGKSGMAATLGVQSNPGVGVTIKHYALNQQETDRSNMDTAATERTIREIYLKGFQMVVENADPYAIMTSYNDINGTPAADHAELNNDIARGEWGFNGLIMTDWGGGQSNPAISMTAGNDLIMPGGEQRMNQIIAGYEEGVCTKADIQRSVYNILKTAMRMNAFLDQYALVQNVVKTELEDLAAMVEDLIADGTITLTEDLQEVLENAQAILDNEIDKNGTANTYTQAQVDSAVEELLTAAAGASSVYKEFLQRAVNYVNNYDISEHLNEIVRAGLEDAMERAQAVLDDPFATQDKVDDMYYELQGWIAMIDWTADKTQLKALYDAVEDMDVSMYPQELQNQFNNALQNAKDVLDDQTALDETGEIQDAIDQLQSALDALANHDLIDTRALETVIALAEGYNANLDKYMDGTAKDTFIAALDAAKGALENKESQEAIDIAEEALIAAILDLRLTPDKGALAGLVSTASSVDQSAYTQSSTARLNAALDVAVAVLADSSTELENVQGAYSSLQTALNNLVEAVEGGSGTNVTATGTTSSSDDDGDSSSSTTGTTSKGTSNPKTGEYSVGMVFALLMAAGIFMGISKKVTNSK